MTNDPKNKTEVFDLTEKSVSTNSPARTQALSKTFYKYLVIYFLNLIFTTVLILAMGYFLGQKYLMLTKPGLSNTAASVAPGPINSSEVKELREQFTKITRQLEEVQLKTAQLEQRSEAYAEFQQRLQTIQTKLNDIAQKNISKSEGVSWKEDCADAIKLGLPLHTFLEKPYIPEKIRTALAGIDFIPTYKSILQNWSDMKDNLGFRAPSSEKKVDSFDWSSRVKAFLKSAFKIQRLNEDDLTQEEIFTHRVEKLLIEKNIEELLQWIAAYEDRFDTHSKDVLTSWVKKLERFRQGQLILEMVKKY